MSNIGANNEIINMQNTTAQYKAATEGRTTGTKTMDSDVFLKLMMEQLKYQDPMSPVDNKDFIAQQAQFTQVSEAQKLNKNTTVNNGIMQTLALVGKEVTMVDPENSQKTIKGKVTEASFDGEASAITVNGKQYPLSLVQSVREPAATTTGTGTGSTTGTGSGATT